MPNTRKNLRGITCGYLKALRPTGEISKRGDVIWLVRCRCKKLLRMAATAFSRKTKRGKLVGVRSCGCYARTTRSPRYKGVGDLSSTRWRNVLIHARRKKLEVTISIEYAWQLFLKQGKRCALTGVPLVMSPKSMKAGASTASLDRIVSSRGYTPGNVQWVHVLINDMKSDFTQREFIDWCRLVAANAPRRHLAAV